MTVLWLLLVSSVVAVPSFLGIKNGDENDPATELTRPVVHLGSFPLDPDAMTGDGVWDASSRLRGRFLAATTDEGGRVVLIRRPDLERSPARYVMQTKEGKKWSRGLVLPWANSNFASLSTECCPTEEILFQVSGSSGMVLRKSTGAVTVFDLTTGISTRNYYVNFTFPDRFNSTHLIATHFAEFKKAPSSGAGNECEGPIEVTEDSGAVVLLDWSSGAVTVTAAQVPWSMRRVIITQEKAHAVASCGGKFRVYEIPLGKAGKNVIFSRMVGGKQDFTRWVCSGTRILGLHYGGYDTAQIFDLESRTHTTHSFAPFGDMVPLQINWQ